MWLLFGDVGDISLQGIGPLNEPAFKLFNCLSHVIIWYCFLKALLILLLMLCHPWDSICRCLTKCLMIVVQAVSAKSKYFISLCHSGLLPFSLRDTLTLTEQERERGSKGEMKPELCTRAEDNSVGDSKKERKITNSSKKSNNGGILYFM